MGVGTIMGVTLGLTIGLTLICIVLRRAQAPRILKESGSYQSQDAKVLDPPNEAGIGIGNAVASAASDLRRPPSPQRNVDLSA